MVWFGNNNRSQQLGVDIGSTSLKLVQMSHDRGRWTLDGYAVEPLASNLLVDGQMLDTDEISARIKKAVKKHKFKAKHAIAAVSYSDVITKSLSNTHALQDRDLEHWVAFEIEKFVPYSVDELRLDFHQHDNSTEVSVIACRRETVDNLAECLDAAGLEAAAVDVSSYALGRALKHVLLGYAGGGMNALSAVVEIGATATRYSVFSAEKLLFHHDLPSDAGTLVHQFAEVYRLPLDVAEAQFLSNRFPKGFSGKVLRPYMKQVIGDIQRGAQYFAASGQSKGQSSDIGHIFLAGGVAQIKGIDRVLQKSLGIEVHTLDTLASVGSHKKLDRNAINKQAPQLALACGLAMWQGEAA